MNEDGSTFNDRFSKTIYFLTEGRGGGTIKDRSSYRICSCTHNGHSARSFLLQPVAQLDYKIVPLTAAIIPQDRSSYSKLYSLSARSFLLQKLSTAKVCKIVQCSMTITHDHYDYYQCSMTITHTKKIEKFHRSSERIFIFEYLTKKYSQRACKIGHIRFTSDCVAKMKC